MSERTPLRPGLFRIGPNGPALLGSRCGNCGHIEFPVRTVCVSCRRQEPDEIELGPGGELLCETTLYMRTAHFPVGHVVGYVALHQGPRVFSPLRPVDGRPLRVGMGLKLEIVPLWREGSKEVLGYRFYAP